MASSSENKIPLVLHIKKGDDLKTIYAKARKAFTAAELAEFLVDEPMYPIEDLMAKLEAMERDEAKARRKATKKKA